MDLLFIINERPAPDVQIQPHVELHHWRILERGSGTLHIAAKLVPGSFRVTSMLVAIDLQKALVRTESGRSYHLLKPPQEEGALRSLMIANAVRDLAVVSRDVSDIIWAAISTGAWSGEDGSLLSSIQ